MALRVTSPAFRDGAAIPERFSCKGEDTSPPLAILGIPPGTQTLALVMDDPDAPRGTWTHWSAWNIPPGSANLREGVDLGSLGAVEGVTSAKATGYHGPCPPSGTHRYFFHVYALDCRLNLASATGVEQLRHAMQGHVLDEAATMGTFAK